MVSGHDDDIDDTGATILSRDGKTSVRLTKDMFRRQGLLYVFVEPSIHLIK